MGNQWVHTSGDDADFFDALSEQLATHEREHPGIFPDLRSGSRVHIFSDYSGDAPDARFDALALLFTPAGVSQVWNEQRISVRQRYLCDSRTMSYKALGSDRRRARALLPFLNAANALPGLILVVLLDKRIQSLFAPHGQKLIDLPEVRPLSHWKNPVLEKAYRLANVACCFLNGLGAPGQILLWITDKDAIVANEQRKNEFMQLIGSFALSYPRVRPPQIMVETTELKKTNDLVEDLVAIPDLTAGALVHLLDEWPEYIEALRHGISVPVPQRLQPKTRAILRWLQDDSQSLKRLFLIVDQNAKTHGFNAMILKFHSIPWDGVAG